MNTNPGQRLPMIRPVCRLGRRTRLSLAVLALGLVGVLATARMLRPDPRGFGTHTQLGLGPCGFRELTGRSCPACGMTTSFAWAVRGRIVESWRANPAGSVIAPVCLILVPWLLAAAISGRPWPFRSADVPLVAAVLVGVGLALVNWAFRELWIG